MIQEILQNKIVTFLASGLLILYIGLYKELNPNLRNTIHKKIRKPFILFLLLILSGLFSYANVVICVLLLLSILITLSTPINSENVLVSEEVNNSLQEGFTDKDKKGKPSYLQDYFKIDPKKYTNAFKEGIIENKRKKVEEKIKRQFKNNNSSKIKQTKKKKSEVVIPKRKFNIEDQEDKNLLNTKQICHDIINRITFKYEDKPYLKKYIATRVEEMVDINNLLDEDED